MDIDNNIDNVNHIRVTETITFYDESVPIGTLEIDVRDMIVAGVASGTFVAHGLVRWKA